MSTAEKERQYTNPDFVTGGKDYAFEVIGLSATST